MGKLNKISTIIYWLVMIFILLIGGIVAAAAFDVPGGIKLFTVQSGSMEPNIHTGSLVFIKPEITYKTGDVITFKSEKERRIVKPQNTTTHRIIEVKQENNRISYITKGDANNAADTDPTPADLVLGRIVFQIPLIGYLVSYARTMQGLIILIVIPATIIIYSELINIKNETSKLIAKKRQGKLNLTETVEENIAEEIIVMEKKDK